VLRSKQSNIEQWAVVSLTVALIAALAGSTAYAIATIGQPPLAGPRELIHGL
jgi:hypothetical protein